MAFAISRALSQVASFENVQYELRDAHGNLKPLFQEYWFTQLLIKKGLLNPQWINHPNAHRISPFLGYWSTTKRVRNLVTSAGKALVAGRINGSGAPAAATYIAVGTGTTAAAAGDTTLQTETATSGLSRAAGTVSLVTTSVTNDTAQITNTFSVTGSVAVTESGVLNAASTGTLLCRQVFSAINVANGDSLAITWKVQAS
jgi:hypothetical protein